MNTSAMYIALTAVVAVAMMSGAGMASAGGTETAIFAGGCFWCMQPPFKNTPGVVETKAGYTGGSVENPTYGEVTTQTTGHYEAVQVVFDPKVVSYEKLLDVFWHNIDPTDPGGQFADRGNSYETAIFYLNEAQKTKAEKSKADLAASGKFQRPIATKILPARPFYPAEEDHQDYGEKNPLHYKAYKYGSGRTPYLDKTWPEK